MRAKGLHCLISLSSGVEIHDEKTIPPAWDGSLDPHLWRKKNTATHDVKKFKSLQWQPFRGHKVNIHKLHFFPTKYGNSPKKIKGFIIGPQ